MPEQSPRNSQQQNTTAPPPVRSIITPWIDLLCCGGLSIVAISAYLAYRLLWNFGTTEQFNLGKITLIAALLNWPHFMASYRLLYSSRVQIMRHKWASMAIPALLVCVGAFALAVPDHQTGTFTVNEKVGTSVQLISHFYLAWHYTGQAWGMVSVFAFLNGNKMDGTERWMIRSGIRFLLLWHVVWGSQAIGKEFADKIPFDTIFSVLSLIGLVTLVLGIIGFNRIYTRTGKKPSLRMIAPWAAIYLWYALLYLQPSAIFWVQIFHALQYMIFPIRVELNQHPSKSRSTANMTRAVVYYLILVATGALVFYLPETLMPDGNDQYNLASLIASAVNIHHYFVDGVIWKIRNPEVQRDLFSHLSKN